MKAWGLCLSIIMLGAACSTPQTNTPISSPIEPYIGPALSAPVDFDRADAGVTIIPGGVAPGRQPDGNTVIFASGDGLIVFDTGRHRTHAQKIADRAKAVGQPVAAIINSHWHLDHVSGNILLREAYPAAAVYAHDASLTDALAGFLQRGLQSNRKMLANSATSAGLAEDLRGDIATVEQGVRLHPTISVEASRELVIGNRTLMLHVAQAASAGDIWLYDPASRLVATGDLVTLPAPFLDTACPPNWRAAFDEILLVPFERAVPGHGRVMTRADVTLYRDAFNALLDCAARASAANCGQAWADAASPLLGGASGNAEQARTFAAYYVDNVLRRPETVPSWCVS